MKRKFPIIICLLLTILSCKKDEFNLTKIKGSNINISDSLPSVKAIDSFIKPYKDHVNKNLDSILAYSVDTYSKSDGELETALGNFMADVIYEQSNPIFKSRTGKNIDFLLLNHGGMRAIISKGNVTLRSAYKLMPFENAIVVADLKGEQVKELLEYLARNKRAHPIAKLKVSLDKDDNLGQVLVNGTPIDDNRNYFVCTNDYLANGGDRMNFFKTNDSLYVLDYKIRNALIDYLKKVDTINPIIDNRFIQTN